MSDQTVRPGGQADVTGALRTAVDRAGEGGGLVTLPAGEFCWSDHIAVPSGVTIRGSGRGATTLRRIDGGYFSLNSFTSGESSPVDVISLRATGQCSIRDVVIRSADADPVRTGVRIETSGPLARTTLDTVSGVFGRAPSVALVEIVEAGALTVRDMHANLGATIADTWCAD